MRLPLFALVLLLGIAAFQVAYYAPRLPDTVASHFGPGGEPDGWSSKTGFLVGYGGVVALTTAPFLVLPWLLPRIPESLVNLPHKAYWLAPERREETFRTISAWLLWLAVGTLMLLTHLLGVTMAENLTPEPRLGSAVWWPLGLYLAFVAVWSVAFVRRFYRTPEKPSLQGG